MGKIVLYANTALTARKTQEISFGWLRQDRFNSTNVFHRVQMVPINRAIQQLGFAFFFDITRLGDPHQH